MKKNVKRLLTQHRADVLPDERVKEKVKRDLGLSSVRESRLSYAEGGERSLTDGRKVAIAVVSVLVVVALFLGVFLPLWLQGSPGAPPVARPDPTPGQGDFGITDADSFYAYGAASVGSILSASDTGAVGAAAASAMTQALPGADGMRAALGEEEQAALLDKYLSLVQSLLGESGITEEGIAPEYGFSFGMRVFSTDLAGNVSAYELYYNKRLIGAEQDEDEREENYAITGVLITADGGRFNVEGKYQTETEVGESESELFFRAYTSADDRRSYIQVKQEYENEQEDGESEREVEYVYTVVKDEVRQETMTVEYEEEENEKELVMTISKGGRTEELTFEDELENGMRVINVEGTLDGERVQFRIYVTENGYDYVFPGDPRP